MTSCPVLTASVVEAYHWGKFTSGSWSQAIWLLLAPFGIVNAAQFTLEPPSSRRARLGLGQRRGRCSGWLALALTVLFVLGTAVISLDLWAWQRIELTTTVRDRLIATARPARPGRPSADVFQPRAIPPGGHRRSRYGRRPGMTTAAARERCRIRRIAMAARSTYLTWCGPVFLGGDARAPALRLVHLATGLAVVAVLGFAPRRNLDDAVALVGFLDSYALAAACVVGVMVLGDPEHSSSVALDERGSASASSRRDSAAQLGRGVERLPEWVVCSCSPRSVTAASPTVRENSGGDPLSRRRPAGEPDDGRGDGRDGGPADHERPARVRGKRNSVARRGIVRFRTVRGGLSPAILLASLGIFVGLGYVGRSA